MATEAVGRVRSNSIHRDEVARTGPDSSLRELMMKRSLLALPIACLLLQAPGRGDTAKEDRKLVEGTWIPREAELAGQKFPDVHLKTMILTMKDGAYTAEVG